MKKKKCLLPGCNKDARRKFCCNKHKDKWHNQKNPRGVFAHLNPNRMYELSNEEYYYASTHPHDSEALGQD